MGFSLHYALIIYNMARHHYIIMDTSVI